MKQHKKLFLTLGVVVVIAAILIVVYLVPYLRRHYRKVSINISDASAMETIDIDEKKVLTVYFTRVGNLDFEEDVDAVSSASLMEGNGELPDMELYDTVVLVYPKMEYGISLCI